MLSSVRLYQIDLPHRLVKIQFLHAVNILMGGSKEASKCKYSRNLSLQALSKEEVTVELDF